ncbi:hypothetical protein [Bradyrhizobium cenepequi]
MADPGTKTAIDACRVRVIFKAAEDAGYGILWALETHAHVRHSQITVKMKDGAEVGL